MSITQRSNVFKAIVLLGTLFPVQALSQSQAPTPVIVSVVEQRPIVDVVEVLGTVQANESVNLTSTVSEMVTAVKFDDTQIVQEGDILVELDTSEERAELAEEQFIFDEAQKQVNRLSQLVKRGAVSASVLDTQRRDMLSAQARIQAIQARLDQRIIKAPYDGVLGLRNVSVGALVQSGQTITTIDDVSVMKLDFSVPEVFLASLKPGLEVKAVTQAYPDRTFTGEIKSVSSRIDPVTRSIEARALLPNNNGYLKPGLLMQVRLQKNPRQALIAPEEAVIPEGENNFIFVITNKGGTETAERRQVEIGERQFGQVEILQGVEEGDRVVTHGTNRVRSGGAVTITATETADESLKDLLNQTETAQ
jgi:membrane fusion protein (multidrug efflux system)